MDVIASLVNLRHDNVILTVIGLMTGMLRRVWDNGRLMLIVVVAFYRLFFALEHSLRNCRSTALVALNERL